MSIKRFSADSEYKKDENIRRDAVLQILDWVHGQPHLPKIQEEDVIAYLTACFYSSEVTKQTLDLNYTYRTHIPEFFSNRDPANERFDLFHKSMSYIFPLPGMTEDGYKAIYAEMKPSDQLNISLFNVAAEIRTIIYINDQIIFEEGAQKGWRIIVSLSNTPAAVLQKLSPNIMLKAVDYLTRASAVRLIGIHMVNPPSFIDIFFNILKSFLSKQMMEFIKVHSTLEDLYKLVPKTMLPSNVGGYLEESSILDERYRKRIVENRDYFMEEEKMRVDESLRPGKATSADTLFGVSGSFRKLDID